MTQINHNHSASQIPLKLGQNEVEIDMYLVYLRNQSIVVRKKHILLSAVYATLFFRTII